MADHYWDLRFEQLRSGEVSWEDAKRHGWSMIEVINWNGRRIIPLSLYGPKFTPVAQRIDFAYLPPDAGLFTWFWPQPEAHETLTDQAWEIWRLNIVVRDDDFGTAYLAREHANEYLGQLDVRMLFVKLVPASSEESFNLYSDYIDEITR